MIWVAIGLIFAVCALAFLMVLLDVAIRMRKEHYQIPYVREKMSQGNLFDEDSRCDDLSWRRFKESSIHR